MPSSAACAGQACSTASAIAAAALPAAATKVRPCGGAGSCAPRMRSGSAAETAAWKLCSRTARISGRGERFLGGVGTEVEVPRVGFAEHLPDRIDRHVGVGAALAQVFHVAAVVLVERMEDRVAAAVELERLDAEFLAQPQVEGRRGLEPFPIEL